MPDLTKRGDAPLQMNNEADHRRRIARRANVGLPTDGTKPMTHPLVLAVYATPGDLPAAAQWTYGIVYLSSINAPVYSDGANWKRLSTDASV